jgi:transcriptional regulator GlxA family with amidase domain
MFDQEGIHAEPHSIVAHRLQSAFAELSAALDETLRDQRDSAAACLQRAQAILRTVNNTAAQPSKYNGAHGLAPWQVRRTLAHIEANLGDCVTNKDLAAVARLSESHFNVAFRNSVGRPPRVYIIHRRIERAQKLMLSTEMALSEIALECGFADQAHLSRLFRKFVGEPPAAWRRARANPGYSDATTAPPDGRRTSQHSGMSNITSQAEK